MPALSPTMTEGKLAKWLKQEGDEVRSGDVIAEIETDKATMEVEAVDEGVLARIFVPAGTENVAVNTPIAALLAEGEDASSLEAAPAPTAAKAAPPPPAPAPSPSAAPPSAASTPAAPPPQPAGATGTDARTQAAEGGRLFASPLARRIAQQAGLDLAGVRGSGPRGRIIKADVEQALAARERAPAAAAAPKPEKAEPPRPAAAAAAPAVAGYVEVPNTTMRKVIAQRLSASKRDIPHYYLTLDTTIDALLAIREDLNSRSKQGRDEFKLSVNDFVVRAVGLALRANPDINASWTDDAMRVYQTIDVAVAVATPAGLITPVVRNADAKGLAAISNEVRLLAKRAREGKLMPEEYQGGGFTVSNLGMYGIREFAAIINPPQSAILAVGAAEKRPIVKDGALAIGDVMTCTLSADHRVVDGAKGAEFLATLKTLIEDPITMLL
jgi:pyruvate dehydrogenase E2 component (dihydrolipoamide acetyltransferase)